MHTITARLIMWQIKSITESMWYDEQLAVTKHLYLPFKGMTIWAHALSVLGGYFNNHCLMRTAHMTHRLLIYSYDNLPLSCLYWQNTLVLSQCYSLCVRELDTANGFMHTYAAGSRVFTSLRQWKDWCGIIHWRLTGIHNGTTPDL